MKKNYFRFGILLFLSLTFAGCPKLESPPEEVLPISVPAVEESLVSLPLDLKISELRSIIWKELSQIRYNKSEGNLNIYNGYIDSFKFDLIGNNIFTCRVSARVTVTYKWKFLGRKMKTTCGFKARGIFQGYIGTGGNLDLNLKLAGKRRVYLTKVCNKFLSAKIIPLQRIIEVVSLGFFGNTVKKSIQKAIDKEKDNLTFKNQVVEAARKFSEPIPLTKPEKEKGGRVWLTPNVSKVVYTNFRTTNNNLKFTVAAYAKPQLKYSSTTPEFTPVDNILVQKVNSISPQTTLVADLRFPYEEAGKLVTPLLKKFAEEKFNWLLYKPGDVKFYPSGDKLAASLQILRKINDSELITLYLTGVPSYDKEKDEIYLKDLDFTSSSNSALLKFVTVAAKEDIINEIKKVSRFSVKEEKKSIDETISSFSKVFDLNYNKHGLKVTGSFNKIDVTNTFVDGKDVAAYAKTVGSLQLGYAIVGRPSDNDDGPVDQDIPDLNECEDCENDYYDGEIIVDEDGNIIYTGKQPSQLRQEVSSRTQLYPNPTSETLNIESSKEVKEVYIYNNDTGDLVGKYTNLTSIDISQYPKGIYLVKVFNNDNTEETHRVVKE